MPTAGAPHVESPDPPLPSPAFALRGAGSRRRRAPGRPPPCRRGPARLAGPPPRRNERKTVWCSSTRTCASPCPPPADALAREAPAQHGHGEAGVLGLLPARDVRHHRVAAAAAGSAEDEDHRPASLQQPVERADRSVRGGQREPLGGRAHPLEPPPPDRGPEPPGHRGEGDDGEGRDRSATDQDEQGQRGEEGVVGPRSANPPARRRALRSSGSSAGFFGEVPPTAVVVRREEAESDGRAGLARPVRTSRTPRWPARPRAPRIARGGPQPAGKPNAAMVRSPPARSRSFAVADTPEHHGQQDSGHQLLPRRTPCDSSYGRVYGPGSARVRRDARLNAPCARLDQPGLPIDFAMSLSVTSRDATRGRRPSHGPRHCLLEIAHALVQRLLLRMRSPVPPPSRSQARTAADAAPGHHRNLARGRPR